MCLRSPLSSALKAKLPCLSLITCLSNLSSSFDSQPGGPKFTTLSLSSVIFGVGMNSGGKGVKGVLYGSLERGGVHKGGFRF